MINDSMKNKKIIGMIQEKISRNQNIKPEFISSWLYGKNNKF